MTKRKNGTYQQAVVINGKRHYFYGKTKSEVLAKLRAFEEKEENGETFQRYWVELSVKAKEL